MLTGHEIQSQVEAGLIKISPFDPKRVQPNSYDLTLGKEILTYKNYELDCKKEEPTNQFIIGPEGFMLYPGKLYLASTNEIAGSDYFIPHINGKSSLGRLGLFVHVTAGTGDTGFIAQWTLELVVVQPLRIYADMPVAQILFIKPEGKVSNYRAQGKYAKQSGPVPSKMYKNFKNS